MLSWVLTHRNTLSTMDFCRYLYRSSIHNSFPSQLFPFQYCSLFFCPSPSFSRYIHVFPAVSADNFHRLILFSPSEFKDSLHMLLHYSYLRGLESYLFVKHIWWYISYNSQLWNVSSFPGIKWSWVRTEQLCCQGSADFRQILVLISWTISHFISFCLFILPHWSCW